jgi:hypothetical protein
MSNKEVAAMTGYGPSHVSRIRNSPDFIRAYMSACTRAMAKWAAQRYLGVKPRF